MSGDFPMIVVAGAAVFIAAIVSGAADRDAERMADTAPAVEEQQRIYAGWEKLNQHGSLQRTRTPRGWVVLDPGDGLIYVPDPGHFWLSPDEPEAEPSPRCACGRPRQE